MQDWCRDTFRTIIEVCDDALVNDTYGGAFVESNKDYGCVEWWIGTTAQARAAMRKFSTEANETMPALLTDQDVQREMKKFLERIEPDLPRMVRGLASNSSVTGL
jgi:hypothetical protein